MSRLKVDWSVFKGFVDERDLPVQYLSEYNFYHLFAADDGFQLECKLGKIAGSEDVLDFETNYMPTANGKIQETDYDGAPLTRPKVTVSGWHYSPRAINWTTGQMNSMHNTKCSGEGWGDAGLKFFDSNGDELVQGQSESDADYQLRLDSNCTRTVMWFLPLDAPYDIVGSMFSMKNAPTEDTYAFLTVAPDIPENLGGMVPFFSGGLNLAHLADRQVIYLNGRGAKTVYPDPVYHSNEMWLIIHHPAGQKTNCQIIYEFYKE